MMIRKHHHRRVLATILALSWLLGIEALPALHLASHDDDHTHEPDGTIVRVTLGGHRHADGTIHGGFELEAKASKSRRLDQLAFRTPSDHAASGIAHHAAALAGVAPPLVAPLPIDRTWVDTASRFVDRLATLDLARPNARGPPAS